MGSGKQRNPFNPEEYFDYIIAGISGTGEILKRPIYFYKKEFIKDCKMAGVSWHIDEDGYMFGNMRIG